MHFSEDVARIILEFSTDTVLSVMEQMYKISNELDIYQIKAYIAMEEWDDKWTGRRQLRNAKCQKNY